MVSVIITCYNLEAYICEAIESVLAQDYGGRYEILVIDDCSTDRSPCLIRQYTQVAYHRTDQNSGVLLSTMLGLNRSSGEIIMFLDGDDVWESSKMRRTKECFDQNPTTAFISHDLEYIDSQGMKIHKKSRPSEVLGAVNHGDWDLKIRRAILLMLDYIWLGSACAIRRSSSSISDFCKFVEARPSVANAYQDWPIAFWIACEPRVTFGYIPAVLFSYRLHGANYSGDASTLPKFLRNLNRSLCTFALIREIAKNNGCSPEITNAIELKILYYNHLVTLYSSKEIEFRGIPFIMLKGGHGMVGLIREIVRYILIRLIGPEKMIQLTNVVKVLKGWWGG